MRLEELLKPPVKPSAPEIKLSVEFIEEQLFGIKPIPVTEPIQPTSPELIETGLEEPATTLDELQIPDYIKYDPEIVGYPDDDFQRQIYESVLSNIGLNDTVVDFGCGRGDFGKYLPPTNYVGFDRNEILIKAGKELYPQLDLRCSDYMNSNAPCDHTVVIGTLNNFDGQDKWERFKNTLEVGLALSSKSVIFVLQRSVELEGYCDFPIEQTIPLIPSNLPFKVDYTKFEDIYVLVVYTQPFF